VAHKTAALDGKDLERVVVDTTVQEKAIEHPTDARLLHRAIEKLIDLAGREGVTLRQVECIGRGKAHAAYEFGCKVSITTPVTSPKGGQFVLHAKALHGNPFDGHTLGPVIAELEKLTGTEVHRIHVDKGYRGHNYPHRFRVWISGQVRRVTKAVRREMRRRATVEPVIGHLQADHRMGHNHLKGHAGDRANALLAAAGYNFSLLLRWLDELLRALLAQLHASSKRLARLTVELESILHGRLSENLLFAKRGPPVKRRWTKVEPAAEMAPELFVNWHRECAPRCRTASLRLAAIFAHPAPAS
jgi:hypothetical protein